MIHRGNLKNAPRDCCSILFHYHLTGQLPTGWRTLQIHEECVGAKANIYKWPFFFFLHTGWKLFLFWDGRGRGLYVRMTDWLLRMNKMLYRFSLEYLRCCVWVLHLRQVWRYIPVLQFDQICIKTIPQSPICVKQNIEENCVVELEILFFVYIATKP